jgi:hypothetical protein
MAVMPTRAPRVRRFPYSPVQIARLEKAGYFRSQGFRRTHASLCEGFVDAPGRPLTRPGPVAERGLYQRQRRDASGVRPQDPRPQAQP